MDRAAKIHILQPKDDDRISVLPEAILHHILCFLSQKEAIKTCVLSKPWRYLGLTRPKFEFAVVTSDDSAILDRTLKAYHDRNLRLDELSLWLSDDNENDCEAAASFVNKWIPIIIQNMRVRKLDFYFDSGPKLQLPSLIFESHHIQNLSLKGCTFDSSATHINMKNLQRLHLRDVYIPEEILDKVLSTSCPFIEDLSLEDCEDFTTIKLLSYEPPNLTHFSFSGHRNEYHHVNIKIGNCFQTLKTIQLTNCLLSVSHPEEQILSGSFLCNLTRLHLTGVYIPEQILGDIRSNCIFIENVSLSYCKGFARIELSNKNINKPTNLAHFCFSGAGDGYVSIEIGEGMESLRTVEIESFLFSVSRNKPLELARLTRLSLRGVKLLSESFTCNFHSLEELKLIGCSSIKEFKLSSRSMKRLDLHNISKPFRATIDAPSIVSFHYKGILPQSISFATTNSSDDLWKSELDLGPSAGNFVHCFNELYGLLKAVSQSEITLELDQIVGVSEEAKHQPPVAVEHLRIKRSDRNAHFNAAPFLKMLFRVLRPSFIYMGTGMLNNSNYERKIAELLLKERGMIREIYMIRQRVLEGVGLQEKYWNRSEWQYTTKSLREVLIRERTI